jgi:Tfp pilus assembly protein PilO
MGPSKSTPWVLGTAFAAVALLIGAWLLAISPKLAAASDERDQTQAEQARFDQLQIQLAGLKRDSQNIGTFQDELTGLQVQIPGDEELSTLIRQLSTIATETSVVVTSVSPSSPTPVVGAVAPAVGTATTDSATAPQPKSDTAAQAAGTQALRGLYAIPLDVVVVGTYENTVNFLDKLQTGNPRLILVSRLAALRQEAVGANGGLPALASGDLQLTFTAYAFAMPDPRKPVAAPTPAPLPVPAGQPNPFLPLK